MPIASAMVVSARGSKGPLDNRVLFPDPVTLGRPLPSASERAAICSIEICARSRIKRSIDRPFTYSRHWGRWPLAPTAAGKRCASEQVAGMGHARAGDDGRGRFGAGRRRHDAFAACVKRDAASVMREGDRLVHQRSKSTRAVRKQNPRFMRVSEGTSNYLGCCRKE